jgi:hypothetical protein
MVKQVEKIHKVAKGISMFIFTLNFFFAKTQKALRFDALIEKERVFTYVQAQKS